MGSLSASIGISEVLRAFPCRQARRGREHRDILDYLQRLGFTDADQQVREKVREFASGLQLRRKDRRARAMEYFQPVLRNVAVDTLASRLKRAKTQFAQSLIKKAIHWRQHPELLEISRELAAVEDQQDRDCQRAQDLQRKREQLDSSHSEAWRVYEGSNGGDTLRYLNKLKKLGHEGMIAADLFRAQKASTRAKSYGQSRCHYSLSVVIRSQERCHRRPVRASWCKQPRDAMGVGA